MGEGEAGPRPQPQWAPVHPLGQLGPKAQLRSQGGKQSQSSRKPARQGGLTHTEGSPHLRPRWPFLESHWLLHPPTRPRALLPCRWPPHSLESPSRTVYTQTPRPSSLSSPRAHRTLCDPRGLTSCQFPHLSWWLPPLLPLSPHPTPALRLSRRRCPVS